MEEHGGSTQKIATWLGAGSINIFGRPFSGKDTQAKMLSELLNAPIIGGGDIIRNSGSKGMNDHINTGKLTPQNEYLELILPYLKKQEYSGKPLVLSSLGRWHGEEQAIVEAAKDSDHPIKAVIYLDIDEETVMQRWESAKRLGDRGNRDDDNSSSIVTRLSEFRHKTMPVLDFYKQQGLLVHIEGSAPRDKVTELVITALANKVVA